MHKTPEVGFQALIHPPRLAIGLWVISGAHTQSDSSQLEEFPQHIACENEVSIRNDCIWKPMKLVNLSQEQLSNCHSCERVF